MGILHQGTIATFDDGFQPTGTIHWRNEGPFGLPVPHVEMKKLRHELVLTIEGPDDLQPAIENCLRQGAVNAATAAVAGAFIGAGIGAVGAAWDAFKAAFASCAPSAVEVRIDDYSHWLEWDT